VDLAEALEGSLLACDQRLEGASGHHANVEIL